MNDKKAPTDTHISHFYIDMYILGTCDPLQSEQIEKHCKECPVCNSYLNKISDRSRSIKVSFPDYSSLHQHYCKKSHFNFSELIHSFFLSPLPSKVFIVSILLFCCGLFYFLYNQKIPESYLSVKGGPQWMLFTQGSFLKNQTDSVYLAAGDTIQFFMNTHYPVYYMVAYRDDQKCVKLYHAENVNPFQSSVNNKPLSLPFSIVLDSLWDKQVIFCISDRDSLAVSDILLKLQDNSINVTKNSEIWTQQFTLYRK